MTGQSPEAVRMHLGGESPPPPGVAAAAGDLEMQQPQSHPATAAAHGHADQQAQQKEHVSRQGTHSHPGKEASVALDEEQQRTAQERSGTSPEQIQKQQQQTGRWTRLQRWWKHTWLYEFTATGHEDACAFECSRMSGRRGGYWPPLFKEADLKASTWLRVVRFWTFYVRPWFYMVFILLCSLYFFAVMNNIATWLTNHEADEYNYNPPSNLNTQVPASEQLTGTIGTGGMFKLDDLTHRLIPQASGASYTAWHMFVDVSLVVAMVVSVLLRFAMRDMVRLGEWAAVIIVLFFTNGFIHVLTQYPDPWGSNGSCQDPNIRTYGSWIWHRFNTDYCGDQMFSGHTLNMITALVMLRRVLYDLIGWDSVQLTTFTRSAASYRRAFDLVTQLGSGHAGRPRGSNETMKSNGLHDDQSTTSDFHSAILAHERATCNPKVLTQWPDVTSLPGVDTSNETMEATQDHSLGSGVLMCVRLAEAEGLGNERALEIARLMRMPVHGFDSIEAQEEKRLHLQLRRDDPLNEGKHAEDAALVLAKSQSNAHAARSDDGYAAESSSQKDSTALEVARPKHQQQDQLQLHHSLNSLDDGSNVKPHQRVVMVMNGPLGDRVMRGMATGLPPHASRQPAAGSEEDNVPVPLQHRSGPFALTHPIPASHGGPHVGGHYGAAEGAVNLSRLRKSERNQSDLPCPEWDDVRGHGMNAFYRYRINMPVRERIIASRGPPPYFARRYPRATRWVLNLFRLALFCWTTVFLIGIIRIRYHYGADVMVSIVVTTLVLCNEKLLQTIVPYLYRPVDARYADAPMYPFSIDPQLYEETLSKLGVGGLI